MDTLLRCTSINTRQWRAIVIALLLLMPAKLWANAESELRALLDEIWQYELSVSPLMASREGHRDQDHLLPDLSAQALAKQHQKRVSFRQALDAIDDESLGDVAKINRLMQAYSLDNHINQYQFNYHYVPLTSEYGFHSAVANLPKLADFSTRKGVENYFSRLQQLEVFFAQNIEWMKKGLTVGMTQPQAVMDGFEASVSAYITAPEKSGFYRPLLTLGPAFDEAEKAALRAQAKKILTESVFPAYQQVYDFLTQTYIPQAGKKIGARHWPEGKSLYAERARHYTTTDLTPKQIHELGLSEVKRIREEMQTIIEELAFEGSFADFIQFLRTDPRFYAQTPEELLEYASFVAKQMDAKLPSLFELLPRTPYGVAPVPDAIAPKYTTGRYVSPSNDREPGYYWVNTYALDKRPLYAIPALTLHEAVPGHHLQIMLANENTGLPPVRKTYISAFGEGWGLYSEFLGIESDIYQTPYEHFGRLSYEMWRACRLVVDTGMHMFDWSRQQAIDFMLENTALSEHNVRTEIDRYISWPAQALAYKIGEIRIRELRRKAEEELQDKFDVREFHTAVLEHGSVPLFVLEQNVMNYIKDKQS